MLKPINHKEYPESIFAEIASFLPQNLGNDLRKIAGGCVVKYVDLKTNYTYKNGALHSFDDQPAISEVDFKVWYANGLIHRDNDKPAVIECGWQDWYSYGKRHRDGKPAVIGTSYKAWYTHGVLQREMHHHV